MPLSLSTGSCYYTLVKSRDQHKTQLCPEKPAEPQLGLTRLPGHNDEQRDRASGRTHRDKASGWLLGLRRARKEAGSVAKVQLPRMPLMSEDS